MKKGVVIFLWSLLIVLFLIATYAVFIYTPRCKDESCWEYKLENCKRAKFNNNAQDVVWEYKIKSKSSQGCKVEVSALQVIRGLTKTRELEGKSMDCYIPLNENKKTILISPESDPSLCHGILKEELQLIIIENLYSYILENVGEINEELVKIQGVN
jgi:hypothetical protein